MKKILLLLLVLFANGIVYAQEAVIPPSNRSTATLEKNLLFYATTRYSVSQQGSVSLPLANLFDGNYQPNYSGALDPNNPYVITIENLPNNHVQAGAWIGWTTRYYNPTKFKIEVYNIYDYGGLPGYPGLNTWVTVADENSYGSFSYMAPVYNVSVGKIRLTFYNGSGPSNNIGLSELFFIHPESTVAFDGLMVKYDLNGNVGIGTNSPDQKLTVNGTIHSREVKVDTSIPIPDYVFDNDYQLKSLTDLQDYITKHKHLPEIPSANEMEKSGINLSEMNLKLLKKVEELTLYLIEKNQQILQLQKISQDQSAKISNLEKVLPKISDTNQFFKN